MKNLLVLVDFSDASVFVVRKAAELAQELSARIILLHIVEPRPVPSRAGDPKSAVPGAAAWPLLSRKSRAELNARLNALAAPLRSRGVTVKSVAVTGFLLDEILQQSARYRADYVILGSGGRKAAHHLVVGRKATVGKLPCSMIFVPVKGEACQ